MATKNIEEKFLTLLNIETESAQKPKLSKIGGVSALHLNRNVWQKIALAASRTNFRFASLWAQDLIDNFELNVVLELEGSHLLLRTIIAAQNPTISSFTPYFPAANRLERHTHDMLGICFTDHPTNCRWTRHLAWDATQFPLRKNFSATSTNPSPTTPPDTEYPFVQITGNGICEIPVGPVHAGIIEPGHFRFQIAGEDIFNLEERLGYTHKGIEKIAEGRSIDGLIRLAGRVSGDTTVAHAWATCAALENGTGLAIPPRASHIRAIMCERERIANHLGDFAAICNDIGYTFAYYQLNRLKELYLRINKEIFDHRLMMDKTIVGGVAIDLDPENCTTLHDQNRMLKQELDELLTIFEAHSGLYNRTKTTGILKPEQAISLGTIGYAGRASNHNFDLRYHAPYPPYDKLKINVPTFKTGDVIARLHIRLQEIFVAMEIINELLDTIPPGPIHTPWISTNKPFEGIGLVESWRGEIITFVRLDHRCLVERYFPRDPSWFIWPALEQSINGNIVPDFPVCNKSMNGSYSGVDL